MERVIGYIRVSTDGQGLGLQAQEAQLREECQRRGWSLSEVVSDQASGKSLNREGLKRALSHLGKGDVLMVSKSDRVTRSVKDLYDLMDASSRDGWHLVDLEMGFDSSDPSGRMIAGMRAVISQWEREMISKRTREALAEKRRQGFRLGRPIVISSGTISRIASLRSSRLSVRMIVEKLNEEGVPTVSGGRWHPTTVRRYLRESCRAPVGRDRAKAQGVPGRVRA